MDRALYKRWRNHPLRQLLNHAQQGGHVYPDQLDDLRLPPKVRKAAEQAIERVRQPDAKTQGSVMGLADDLSSVLVDSLPEHHETREQHEIRRAQEGDGQALANRQAQKQATDDMVDQIVRGH